MTANDAIRLFTAQGSPNGSPTTGMAHIAYRPLLPVVSRETDCMPPLAPAFRQTLLWGLAFAMLGSLLGMTLGWGAPVYYQTVFSLR